MNSYKRLATNTVVFAIGTFSSKLLVFFLLPLYTRALKPEEFGLADIIVQTANLLIPLATLGMAHALVRFGLEKSNDKSAVFSTGLAMLIMGFCALLILYPLLKAFDLSPDAVRMIFLFVLTAGMRSLCAQFVRSLGKVRLFAVDGVLATVYVIAFNILFLVVMKMGLNGFVLSTIVGDILSTLFLLIAARLWRYIDFKKINRRLTGAMLKYSLPLIPTTMFWWVTSVSDRFLITGMVGYAANGLYAVAYKLPTVVTLLSTIFQEAWQISAFTEGEDGNRDEFFSNVFGVYQSAIFLAAGGIILLCQPLTRLLVANSYYDSWRYVPLLAAAMAYSCFCSFFGTIYMLEKRSKSTLVTTALGAGLNIGMNILLIPIFGAQGAAIATFASYFLVFVVRAIDTRRFLVTDPHALLMATNLGLIGAQGIILALNPPLMYVWEALAFAALVAINGRNLLAFVVRIMKRRATQ